MNSERFEALIDAVLAIIITIIVLEIPLASQGTWASLFEYRLEFITYAVSFIACFKFWNYHQNFFSIVNKIDYKILWIDGISLLVLSFLPYLTTFVAENFYSPLAQGLYGLNFVIVLLLNHISTYALKDIDKGNIALQLVFKNLTLPVCINYTVLILGYIIGFTIYPPAIIVACFISQFISNPLSKLIRKIKQ